MKTYRYTAESCPSKHNNDGSDICTDCGQDLNGTAPTSPHVRRFLDVSNAHVSPAARAWLDATGQLEIDRIGDGGTHNVAITRHGWFVYAPGPDTMSELFHDDLRHLAAHARSLGCDYILFDADAEEIDGFQTYDW